MGKLEEQFTQAAKDVTSGAVGNLSQSEQLRLYGLYSVVKKGDPPESSPSALLDPRGYAKWAAWKDQSHLGKEDAMREYTQLVKALASVPRNTSSTKTDDGLGNKGSTGFDISFDGEENREETRDLNYWAATGNIEAVLNCLEKMGVSPNYRDEDNLTALMRAADRDEKEVVDILVEAGAVLDAVDDGGQSALHYAVLCEHIEMAAILVHYGASTDLKDSEGVTPLSTASPAIKAAFEAVETGTWKRKSTRFTKRTWQIPSIPSSLPMSYWMLGAASVAVLATFIAIRYRNS